MKRFIKKLLNKLFGINKKEIIHDLERRIDNLEKHHGELIDFISQVFPHYFRQISVSKNYEQLKGNIGRYTYWDKDLNEVMKKKEKEVVDELKRSITDNSLDIRSICLKVSEEVFNEMFNKKFPVSSDSKAESEAQ